ncbi:hypothetical protein GCM10025865_19730 [Paraoerskovia sediminicola]|uniref:Phosphoserine transaminase n=1 Tax=Paraoerskovia sediminicola TaxID=1138587 RepID=A0ABN6XCQ9_9CELL|nr:hypothetical protein GCM10025865_19730 [Paraoerskovia sediminicola]
MSPDYRDDVPETTAPLTIPETMLPRDGRFGSGPSKVRPEQVSALVAASRDVLGTSHRQPPVKALVRRVREGIGELFSLPDGYEVALGNGGSTTFWDVATFCLVREKAQHAAFGEFGAKFAKATSRAPFLAPSEVVNAEPGTVALPTRRTTWTSTPGRTTRRRPARWRRCAA